MISFVLLTQSLHHQTNKKKNTQKRKHKNAKMVHTMKNGARKKHNTI